MIETKGCGGCIPQKVWVVILYKAKKWHASTCTSEVIGCLVFYELSKLRLRAQTPKKGLIKYIIGEAEGVVGATPEGMGWVFCIS